MRVLASTPRAGQGRAEWDRRFSEQLLKASGTAATLLLLALGTSTDGLTVSEVRRRQGVHGKNEVAHDRPPPWYRMLLGNFTNPFIVLLLILGVVSYGTDDLKAVGVVSVMVTVSVLMRFLQEYRLICKGVVEEVLAVCTRAADGGTFTPLTAHLRRHVLFMRDELNADGLRVIAVAYRVSRGEDRPYSVDDERDLVLAGFIAFLDPPKEPAGPALEALRQSGTAAPAAALAAEKLTATGSAGC